jgi:hypothetical protein
MKHWLFRGVMLAALIAAGIWGWRVLFPGPEQVIRKRLTELARAASFRPDESPFAAWSNSQEVTTFCTSDVEITVEGPGHSPQTLNGREELLQAAAGVRSIVGSLKVEFLDTTVTVVPGKPIGFANLTAKGTVPGDKDFLVQELKFTFKKIDGHWLISRVETVKTLL